MHAPVAGRCAFGSFGPPQIRGIAGKTCPEQGALTLMTVAYNHRTEFIRGKTIQIPLPLYMAANANCSSRQTGRNGLNKEKYEIIDW